MNQETFDSACHTVCLFSGALILVGYASILVSTAVWFLFG